MVFLLLILLVSCFGTSTVHPCPLVCLGAGTRRVRNIVPARDTPENNSMVADGNTSVNSSRLMDENASVDGSVAVGCP